MFCWTIESLESLWPYKERRAYLERLRDSIIFCILQDAPEDDEEEEEEEEEEEIEVQDQEEENNPESEDENAIISGM